MAFSFTPEDGTGLPSANSYFDLETIQAVMDDLESPAWDNLDEVAQQKLAVRVTANLDLQFRFYGAVFNEDQALQWPRTKNYDDRGKIIPAGEMPNQLLKAVVLMCKEAAEDDDPLDVTEDDVSGNVKSWSTEGLSVSFGGKGETLEERKMERQLGSLFETQLVEVQVLLRSIGALGS